MKTVLSILFLALMAQGEDLHLKLNELHSTPEVNWLKDNEVDLQMATSGRSVSLMSESRSNFPPVTTTEWTTEEEILKMAGRRQVNLAAETDGQPQPGFPDKLGIGSREELRDFIVAVRGMGMNVWLTLQYYKKTGGYFQIKVGRYSEGYKSFLDMLEDTEDGFNVLMVQLNQKSDYKEGSEVWAQISVTYLNDRDEIVPKPFGLSLPRKQEARDTLNAKKISESFISSDPDRDLEAMVATFPTIAKFELQLSLTNNMVATMTWTKVNGMQLASWPREYPERVADNYIEMSGWLCYGTHRMRMKISSVTGEETYTEFGERLSAPTTLKMENKSTLVVNAPKGADVEVQSSQDLRNWTSRGFVTRVTGRLVLTVPDEGHMSFRTAEW